MKTTFLSLLTMFILFSCSTDEELLHLNDNFNSTSRSLNSANSNRGNTIQPPTLHPYEYYTYTIKFNKVLTVSERNDIRAELFEFYNIYTYELTEVENIEIWYTTLNPLAQEPSLTNQNEEDGDFQVIDFSN